MNCVTHHEACECREAENVEVKKRLAAQIDKLLLQNRELQNRVEMLKASLESILKRELGLDFQTYLDSKAAMPTTRVLLDEVIDKLTEKVDACSVCKKAFTGTFKEKRDAWCEKCDLYVCSLCWAAHNMNLCRPEKRVDETPAQTPQVAWAIAAKKRPCWNCKPIHVDPPRECGCVCHT